MVVKQNRDKTRTPTMWKYVYQAKYKTFRRCRKITQRITEQIVESTWIGTGRNTPVANTRISELGWQVVEAETESRAKHFQRPISLKRHLN